MKKNMKCKFLVALALPLFCTATVTAQTTTDYSGTQLYDRIGHGQDSVEVINNLSLYQDYFKQKDYASALPHWKYVFEHAPLAQIRVYTDGAWILENLIYKETDAAKKKEYFELLMKVYDQRLENLEALNSFATEKTKTTRGNILCRKAYDYASYGGTDNEVAYKMFRSGINDMGPNTEAFVLYSFIQCSYRRYQANKDNTTVREEFIRDYMECNDICDRLLETAKEYAETDTVMAQKIVANYQPTQDKCNELFVTSGAADCDALEKIYTEKVEANKTNLEYLNSVLGVLTFFECDKSDIYYKASDYAYELNKTPNAAIGKAQKLFKDGKTDEALKYFQEAIDLETDNNKKAKISYTIAAILYRKGSIGECRQYCNQTLRYEPSNGKAWLLIANCIVRSASGDALERSKYYCLAIDKCNKAKAIDPSCASQANRQISSYRSGLYPKSEAFFQGIMEGTKVTVMGETTTMRFR